MKILILYSGGLDSLIMRHYAKVNYPDAEVKLMFYDIGQDYAQKELDALPNEVEIRKLDWLNVNRRVEAKGESSSGAIIIPGRNLVLSVLAACQEVPNEIWMGALLGETHAGSTDKNFTFLEKLNETLAYVLSPFEDYTPRVRFPLAEANMDKYGAVEWYLNNGGDIEKVNASSSCLTAEMGKTRRCGHCLVCLRRWGIMHSLGFEEVCNHHPADDMSESNREMVLRMIQGELGEPCHYDEHRRREIIPALLDYYGDTLEELRARIEAR